MSNNAICPILSDAKPLQGFWTSMKKAVTCLLFSRNNAKTFCKKLYLTYTLYIIIAMKVVALSKLSPKLDFFQYLPKNTFLPVAKFQWFMISDLGWRLIQDRVLAPVLLSIFETVLGVFVRSFPYDRLVL